MKKRAVVTVKKPFMAKAIGVDGFKYKETITLMIDVDSGLPGVLIDRLVEYSHPKDIMDGELLRIFNGKYYVRTSHALKLEHFLRAADRVEAQIVELSEAAGKHLEESPKEEEKTILINQIKTPDGTIIVSQHRHDYVEHKDKNGFLYAVDGGAEYLRRSYDTDAPEYDEISLYFEDTPFETIRQYFRRGGRGKDGKQPLTWVLLCQMSNAWVEATITYEEERRPNNKYLPYFKKEIEYRKDNNINIAD